MIRIPAKYPSEYLVLFAFDEVVLPGGEVENHLLKLVDTARPPGAAKLGIMPFEFGDLGNRFGIEEGTNILFQETA